MAATRVLLIVLACLARFVPLHVKMYVVTLNYFPLIIVNLLFIVFIRSSPDIRWKFYKNTANNRTKKEKIKIYENRMLSAI